MNESFLDPRKDLARVENVSWVKELLCEAVSSAILTFVSFATVANTGSLAVGFSEGTGYFVPILLFGMYMPVHMNAAVTLAMFIFDLVSRRAKDVRWLFLVYPLAQYVGSLFGLLGVWATTGTRTLTGLGGPVLGPGVTDGTGFGTEAILASVLVLVFMWSAFVTAAAPQGLPFFIRAFGILFVMIGLVFAGSPVVGVSISPMRYLAVITLAGAAPSNWWIWVWAPFVGAIAAALIAIFMLWVTVSTSTKRVASAARFRDFGVPNGSPKRRGVWKGVVR